MFSKIRRIIFIGGNRFKEDGPLLEFVDICIKSNIACDVISDQERSVYPTESMGTLSECLNERGIKLHSIDKLSVEIFRNYEDKDTLIFCVNCKWILSSEMINIFPGRVFNYHNSALPEQRGAACHSWRLMQSINFTRLTIHEVSPAIDKGKVYIEDTIEFDKSISNLTQSYQFISSREGELFSNFLKRDSKPSDQLEGGSYYWPKLSTEVNGYINWSWSAEEIVAFCNAFDKPFDGASTFLMGSRARFSNVMTADEGHSFHPFQAGLIYRISESDIYIATRQGGICVKELKLNKSINIRAGLRFVTPTDVLFSALTTQV